MLNNCSAVSNNSFILRGWNKVVIINFLNETCHATKFILNTEKLKLINDKESHQSNNVKRSI